MKINNLIGLIAFHLQDDLFAVSDWNVLLTFKEFRAKGIMSLPQSQIFYYLISLEPDGVNLDISNLDYLISQNS